MNMVVLRYAPINPLFRVAGLASAVVSRNFNDYCLGLLQLQGLYYYSISLALRGWEI